MLDVCWTYVGCVLDECWTSKPYSCLYLARSRAADLLPATLWRTLGAQTVSLPASGGLQARKPTPCYHLARGRRPDHCPACVWRTPGPQTYSLLPSGARSAPKPLPCLRLGGNGRSGRVGRLPSHSTPIQLTVNSHSTSIQLPLNSCTFYLRSHATTCICSSKQSSF